MKNTLNIFLGVMLCMPIAQNLFSKEKLFSDRAGARDKFIAVVKLKQPALLSSSKIINGRTIVDEKLKNKILKEQNQFLKKIKDLSPEVKVLFKYRLILNGMAILLPKELESDFRKIPGVSSMEYNSTFARPSSTFDGKQNQAIGENTSVSFIGANNVHGKLNITGKNITVGVLDTGIDYTHTMFGGSGSIEAFESIDPSEQAPDHYPNSKVIGGIDLVGTDYNAASADFEKQIPKPDTNPIDEGGHGTHVAGSIAGIGDNENSYSGVAPDAFIHAIKVFGARGSTSDSVILAGLEYSADPNKDLNPKDKLDVVNLSLGGGFGKPHILYNEAIKNLTNGGTIVVASAGNAGHEPYIVGAPSTAKEAISVAASVDHMDHNWKFAAAKLTSSSGDEILTEIIEGNISKPVNESEGIAGKLVFAGMAISDFSQELAAKVKGNIAMIDRGEVSFIEKLKRAHKAGAVGVLMVNNKDGAPIRMGGEGKVDLPAIMITKALGDKIKSRIKSEEVSLIFKTDSLIEKPDLIDTLTNFSSQGPRSVDSLLKPEIAAPGANIVSAKMGGGSETVRMSGTSMSGPHIAGVMALMKQKHPNRSVKELKALMLTTALAISDKDKNLYPISKQGAGRVDAFKTVSNQTVVLPATVSLGNLEATKKRKVTKRFTVENLSDSTQIFRLKGIEKNNLKIRFNKKVLRLKAGKKASFKATFIANTAAQEKTVTELNGHILLEAGNKSLSVPVLGILKKESRIKPVLSFKQDQVVFKNYGSHTGDLLLFKSLIKDPRKRSLYRVDNKRSKACDLKQLGYKVIEKQVNEENLKLLQVAVELHDVMTRWQGCELSMLIDSNEDGTPEQEVAGISFSNLSGLSGHTYATFLLDYGKMRELRMAYEKAILKGENVKLNYMPAVQNYQDMLAINHSRFAVLNIDLNKIALTQAGDLNFKFAALHADSGAIEAQDYASNAKWLKISALELENAEIYFKESYSLAAGQKKKIETLVPMRKVMAVTPEQN